MNLKDFLKISSLAFLFAFSSQIVAAERNINPPSVKGKSYSCTTVSCWCDINSGDDCNDMFSSESCPGGSLCDEDVNRCYCTKKAKQIKRPPGIFQRFRQSSQAAPNKAITQ